MLDGGLTLSSREQALSQKGPFDPHPAFPPSSGPWTRSQGLFPENAKPHVADGRPQQPFRRRVNADDLFRLCLGWLDEASRWACPWVSRPSGASLADPRPSYAMRGIMQQSAAQWTRLATMSTSVLPDSGKGCSKPCQVHTGRRDIDEAVAFDRVRIERPGAKQRIPGQVPLCPESPVFAAERGRASREALDAGFRRVRAGAGQAADGPDSVRRRIRLPLQIQRIWLRNSWVRGSRAFSKNVAGGPCSTMTPPSVK